MTVVADQMRGAAIDGAEQEHHILRIHGVVAEVKEDDRHDLAMKGQQADERLDFRRRDAVTEELLRILGEGVEAVEKEKLLPLPAIEDFRRGACRLTAQAGCQQDVCVQHRTKKAGHLQAGDDVLMRLTKPGKRFVPVEPVGFVHLRLAHRLCHDFPRLRAVPLASDRLQPGFMPEIECDAEVQVGDACHPGLHVIWDVESDAHCTRSLAVQNRRCNPSEVHQA